MNLSLQSALALTLLLTLTFGQDVGPRRRLVRRRKNLPSQPQQNQQLFPSEQQQLQTEPDMNSYGTPQAPGHLLEAETRLVRHKIKKKIKKPSSPSLGQLLSHPANVSVPNHPDQAKRCECHTELTGQCSGPSLGSDQLFYHLRCTHQSHDFLGFWGRFFIVISGNVRATEPPGSPLPFHFTLKFSHR